MIEYEELKRSYDKAQLVCDPLDFACRQKELVYALAEYLLARDRPIEDDDEDEDDC